MRRKQILLRALRRPAATRAAAALEFALVGPVLLLFLGGAADFGLAIHSRGRLAAAVSAGAEYAMLHGRSITATQFPTFASAIKSVVAGVSGLNLAAGQPTVSVNTYCIQGSPPALVQSGGTCANGSTPGVYAVIKASFNSPLFLPVGSLASSLAVSQSATVRLQ